VAINCAALPRELINSELFGYSEGAFTGARKGGNKGKVEMANGGTLFLDEIGEMPLEQQTILLRLIENRRIQKIGSGTEIRVDIRIIAATNKDLLEEVNQGRFRRDLYYRLNVFTVTVPSLRERKDDIPPLVYSFLDRLSERTGEPTKTLDPGVLDSLINFSWPGNIRELQNILERVWFLADGGVITMELMTHLGFSPAPPAPQTVEPYVPTGLRDSNRNLSAEDIEKVLRDTNWNISKACMIIGISRPTMYRKINAFDLRRKPE
jgi:transcriptional regulator with PAS, ATPase and Fis domain